MESSSITSAGTTYTLVRVSGSPAAFKKQFVCFKVMSTIASELKAPSQNTPHSSIII